LLWPIDTKLGACNQCNQNNGIIFSSLSALISFSCYINTWLNANEWLKTWFRRIAAFLVFMSFINGRFFADFFGNYL